MLQIRRAQRGARDKAANDDAVNWLKRIWAQTEEGVFSPGDLPDSPESVAGQLATLDSLPLEKREHIRTRGILRGALHTIRDVVEGRDLSEYPDLLATAAAVKREAGDVEMSRLLQSASDSYRANFDENPITQSWGAGGDDRTAQKLLPLQWAPALERLVENNGADPSGALDDMFGSWNAEYGDSFDASGTRNPLNQETVDLLTRF